jgi:hypothetical protein
VTLCLNVILVGSIGLDMVSDSMYYEICTHNFIFILSFENCMDLRILSGNTNNMYHRSDRSVKKHEFSELIFVVHGIGHHMGEHGIVGNTNE